ncbi:MAG: dockerin type I domain-containing protein [bacterium]|nr:dockerin type I domain-containing protein [bacterium]
MIFGHFTWTDTICDINGDGEVNVTDVTTLVNRLLE